MATKMNKRRRGSRMITMISSNTQIAIISISIMKTIKIIDLQSIMERMKKTD